MIYPQISPHFSWREFICHGHEQDCPRCHLDLRLLEGLDDLRERVGRPIVVRSGFRCPAHNRAIGGSPTSQHMEGRAADIHVHGMTPTDLARLAERVTVFARGGIGIYSWGVHVDVRLTGPARFSG